MVEKLAINGLEFLNMRFIFKGLAKRCQLALIPDTWGLNAKQLAVSIENLFHKCELFDLINHVFSPVDHDFFDIQIIVA